jgi:hypothetical protein
MAKKKVVESKVEEGVEGIEAKVESKDSGVVATGKFYAKEVEGGAVVIGKDGKIVSNVLGVTKAAKLADKMNRGL